MSIFFQFNRNILSLFLKKTICFCLLFLFIQITFCTAQNTADTIPAKTFRQGKNQLGIFFSPDYCNQIYKAVKYENSNSTNAYNQQIADTLNSITNSAISYSTGIDILCSFNKHLALKTGIYLAVRSKRYNGFIYYNGIYSGYSVFHMTKYKREQSLFMEIPIALNYTFFRNQKSKIHLDCFAGGLLSINCSKSKIETVRLWDPTRPFPSSEDGFIPNERRPLSVLYTGIIIGAKADFRINDCLGFNFSPTFKYFPLEFWNLSKGYAGGETYELPYSIGCAVGITYYLD